MARKDKNREICERQAAKAKVLRDAHMNLWRGLRQMEGLATKIPHRPMSGERHVLLGDDFGWLRDVLRNESLMLASEIHDEYVEFLKKQLRPASFGLGDHVPTSSYIYGMSLHLCSDSKRRHWRIRRDPDETGPVSSHLL